MPLVLILLVLLTISTACNSDQATVTQLPTAPTTTTPTVTTPPPTTPTPPPPPVTVTSVAVSGSTSLAERGATTQFRAVATLSNGTTEDRTSTATWTSSNPGVATVSAAGVVTAQSDGVANIVAAVSEVRGNREVSVRIVRRTPDPPAGQRLPLPADAQAQIQRIAAARPDLIGNAGSCPRGLKYVRNPWIDYMVDELRKLDTRWGYNAKPNRTAADNSGVPVEIAGDEITYHYSGGPDEGSNEVYPIDILQDHCGTNPTMTFRVFTGEEPVRWTGAGRF